jgi:hypothetical protein
MNAANLKFPATRVLCSGVGRTPWSAAPWPASCSRPRLPRKSSLITKQLSVMIDNVLCTRPDQPGGSS